MNVVLHKSTMRGHAHHGWLDSWHTFSFGSYYDPARMHFGALRVLNDDTVGPGSGFNRHPHQNMEIISLPLQGSLEHQDSTGIRQLIREGDVQVMSAGTGMEHSEKNAGTDVLVKFLQIWVVPNRFDVEPRYEQKSFRTEDRRNRLLTIVSPMGETGGVNIYQDAWFSVTKPDRGVSLEYTLHRQGHGVYAFVLEGDVTINEIAVNRRDGLGITETGRLHIKADSDADLLLMEVPMIRL